MSRKPDKENMRQVILDFPEQFRHGIKVAENIAPSLNTKYIIHNTLVAGMGGSALPGELLKLFNAHLKWGMNVNIHRNYGLPAFIESKAKNQESRILTICISHSGNTEETISAYQSAKKLNLPLVAITTGGELARLAKKDGVPLALIPDTGIQPRAATGYLVAALLKILSNAGIIEAQDQELLGLEKILRAENLENEGKRLAKSIKGKTPIVYISQNYKALAYIWKIKFNENSKTLAFWNYFPELNHNEMVGYTNERFKDKFFTIILRADDDHPRNIKRMFLMDKIAKEQGYDAVTIDILGNKLYSKVFTSILLADWTSYYLALEYGLDPSPVHLVEKFKKLLK
jgi:glucose/mannose-6-phosphate isomerase